MLGAIAGDIIGSVYEFNNIKTTEFPLFGGESDFTDDSVLTIALADSILTGGNYSDMMRKYYNRYPDAGYGGSFHEWALCSTTGPYGSWGNGAAMRISPAAWAYDSLDKVISQAEMYTAVTHNHPDGIKGGVATAAAIYLARTGSSKQQIKEYIEKTHEYDLSRTCNEIRPNYYIDESCQGTVPEAIIAFLESTDFEHAVRLAVSLGGDSDTLACITGSIAEAFYGSVPVHIFKEVLSRLDAPLRRTTVNFCVTHCGYSKTALDVSKRAWWKF